MEAIAVAKTPYTLQFNDLINSANGPWATFTNAAIFGDDVDGAFAKAQSEMQSIIDMRHNNRRPRPGGHACLPADLPNACGAFADDRCRSGARLVACHAQARRPRALAGWRGLLYIAPAMALVIGLLRAAGDLHRLDEPAQLAADGRPALDRLEQLHPDGFATPASSRRCSFTAFYTVIVTDRDLRRRLSAGALRREAAALRRRLPHDHLPAGRRRPRLGLAALGLARQCRQRLHSAARCVALGLAERPPNLLASFDTAFATIIVMVVWKIAGFTMIILLTGLQAIPLELDRGRPHRRRRPLAALPHLTLPLMRRTHRAGADHLGHRLDPRLRPVLHHDQRAGRRTDDLGGLLHLQPVLRVVQPRLWRGAVDRAARHPGRGQHRPALAAARAGRTRDERRRPAPRGAGVAWHVAYHGIGVVAIFFLAPFVITLPRLVPARHRSPAAAAAALADVHGFSLDAYRALDSFGAGIWQHTLNSAARLGRHGRC